MASFLLALLYCYTGPSTEWEMLPSLERTEGFAGSFAGPSNGYLLLAGGANFPGAKPWEGGDKRWYAEVYALDLKHPQWNLAGKLPHALGYGVSASYQGKLICVGGSDSLRHYAEVFSLEYKHGEIQVSNLSRLPFPLANGSGVIVGSRLFVIGGQISPSSAQALNQVWSLDLSDPNQRWREEARIPGPGRILSTAATHSGSLYVFGGVELVEKDGSIQRKYLRDAYVLHSGKPWEILPELPLSLAASASPAPVANGNIYLVSGDDGTQVGRFPPEHLGFNPVIWALNLETREWKQTGITPAPRVTLPCVQMDSRAYFLSGEKMPGIRSPEIWRWDLSAAGR